MVGINDNYDISGGWFQPDIQFAPEVPCLRFAPITIPMVPHLLAIMNTIVSTNASAALLWNKLGFHTIGTCPLDFRGWMKAGLIC